MKKQMKLFNDSNTAYGGDLLKTRKGRAQPRPLSTKHTMHLILKSSKAKGELSFLRHRKMIDQVINFYAKKYCVDVIKMANVSNHLHLHIKLSKRHFYFHFIRVVTGVIAKKMGKEMAKLGSSGKFWDSRPFTRIAIGVRAFLGLQDYIAINVLEGMGATREAAKWLVNRSKSYKVVYGFG